MSVINRMLNDLERRGAPGARRQPTADGPARARTAPRALLWLRRLGAPVLLVALLLVATALWREQWPRMLALVESVREPAAAEDKATGADPSGKALPGVSGFGFERDGATTRLVVTFDRALAEPPGYGRSGDRIGLQLPARWDRGDLPAPPEDQTVYRSAVVNGRGDAGTRIAMRVDPEARFDLAIDGDRLTLTGREPSTDVREEDGDRSAADAPDVDGDAAIDAIDAVAGDSAVRADDAAPDSGRGVAPTSSGTTRTVAQREATGEPDRSERPGQPEGETDDTDAPASVGQDPVADVTREGRDSAIRTAPSADEASGQAGTREAESQGSVRKSEPDIAPQERARRLEAKAREALDAGDVAAARTLLANALEYDADRHSTRDLLVGLSLRSGDAATARNLLAEGVARAPERGAYAKPFARLLVDAGDLQRALRVLRRAAPATDRDAGYHGLTAAVAQRLKRHELAASEYTRALEIDSSRGVWWIGLGISLRATDHRDEALAAFREARASGDLNERLDRWVQQRIEALSRTGE